MSVEEFLEAGGVAGLLVTLATILGVVAAGPAYRTGASPAQRRAALLLASAPFVVGLIGMLVANFSAGMTGPEHAGTAEELRAMTRRLFVPFVLGVAGSLACLTAVAVARSRAGGRASEPS